MSLKKDFENRCASMPGFDSHKDSSGNYTYIGTLPAWDGYIDAELHMEKIVDDKQ